jgi:hypothetical protein
MRRTVVVATLLALLGVVASFDVSLANDGGAVAQQPEHRLGDGRFAGTVPADQPAGHGEVLREPPARNHDGGTAAAPRHVVAQLARGERGEDHRQVL